MPITSKGLNVYPAFLWLYCLFQCSKRGMLGEGLSVCSVFWVLWCSERGARGELIHSLWEGCLYSLLFYIDLAKIQTKKLYMNIVIFPFSLQRRLPHNYIHMHSLFEIYWEVYHSLLPRLSSHPELAVWEPSTSWVCSMRLVLYASVTVYIEVRTLVDM